MKSKLCEIAGSLDGKFQFKEWIDSPVTKILISDIQTLRDENFELFISADLYSDKGVKQAALNQTTYVTLNTVLNDIILEAVNQYNGDPEDQNPINSDEGS
jgi:hypothetical protein